MTNRFKGQLRHCFFGSYHAQVTIVAESEAAARQLRYLLTEDGFEFTTSDKAPKAVGLALVPNQLDLFKDWLEPYLTDKRVKIDSLDHSIDFGPPFEFDLPYVDLNTPSLF